MADSYFVYDSNGSVAERAAELKIVKYSGSEDKCIFLPSALRECNPGPFMHSWDFGIDLA